MLFQSKAELETRFYPKGPGYIDYGFEGTCYRLEDDKVAKIWAKPKPLTDEEFYLQFKDVDIKNFIFINDLIYYPLQIAGAIMPYAPGNGLNRINLCDYPVSDLIMAASEANEATSELSSQGIKVDLDVTAKNTLFDGRSFYFIDTANYCKTDWDEIGFNHNKVLYLLYSQIISEVKAWDLYAFFLKALGVEHLGIYGILNMLPEEALGTLKEKLENYLGENITSFGQADALLKIRKRG